MFRKSLLAAGAATVLAAAPLSAAAPRSVTVPSAMPLAAVGISEVACQPQPAAFTAQLATPAIPAGHPLATPASARMAKSAAILGGQMSALEKMRLAQAGIELPAPAAQPQALTLANATACATIGTRVASAIAPAATGRFLGTERVRIGRTRFDNDWKRVSGKGLSRRDLARSLGAVPQDREELLGTVNRWVNRTIRYRDDRVQHGTADYWADARTTLRSGTGDCEDYAILKMQMLAAAGVSREDMMLTLARDTVQRADHAVLLVRQGDDWVMLDMASDRIAPAAADYGYRPVMSFAGAERFIHGTAVGTPQMQRPVRIALSR
ncbi:MAG TPA: transglutaminase-like cysteine peptidase [Erythrobacter sp.]|nr:transglutaminase-like cysteine peptidase [Erythrobacter sp.]